MRMLLYWDEVGTIVPEEFLREPKQLDPVTLGLVQRGLVTPVVPGYHLAEVPKFTVKFEEFIESLEEDVLAERKSRFTIEETARVPVHVEKLEALGTFLAKKNLATSGANRWYEVESTTATEFMTYLAAVLGQVHPDDFMPMTDGSVQLEEIVNSGITRAEAKLRPIRLSVIEDLLPLPQGKLSPERIDQFKTAHFKKLKGFRRTIESKVVEIAGTQDDDLREYRLNAVRSQLEADVQDIRKEMEDHFGHRATTVGKICFGVAAKLSKTVGIIKAVLGALPRDHETDIPTSPLLYAAYAQSELLNAK